MTTVHDVPAGPFIEKVAVKLKELDAVKAPAWAPFVITGIHREKPPANPEWWHVRVAAVLRKVYILGPIGTERLRAEFGGTRDRGAKPNRAKKGSGSIVRESLQQLEKAGLIAGDKAKGRRVTAKGQKFVDDTAFEVKKELEPVLPGLSKY